ncbi:hypothetical protein IU469_32095 [Nocardia puris]|uniref:Uncharacterized protein n=1 Tax=Nocardia puris TaxID=208602 RepID=A0A366D6S9_9NOCA|nr:hypothetical protein [Nocardia puris]EFV90146.1 hypothetical protein ES5_17728 [Dietzia cinnamea P4]MBF6215841.1 hypothetical protein [Nocardia puris]MBF6370315.1 hypothetical protein [Nocardia puris]RBO85199.1 hypothetical protein DFR74_11547 [Nocardia puris]
MIDLVFVRVMGRRYRDGADMHWIRIEGTDEHVWAPDEVIRAWCPPPSPWGLSRHRGRNERIWRQSHYRTPWQLAVSEGLSETRIRQIVNEAADFYSHPPSD